MRILVVHPRMSIKGGGERVAIHTMQACLRMGHEVSLLSEEFDIADFEDFFGCQGLMGRVSRLAFDEFKPRMRRRLLLYQRLCYYQRQFRKLLESQPTFDLALGTQDVGYTPSIAAPIIHYCYFPEYFSHLQSHPSSPLWQLYYGPARMFYRNRATTIRQFLSTSNYTREFVKRIWGRDSITVYPPCPVELYRSVPAERENLAITVGRIVPDKRMHLLLEIARLLPTFRFIIIGSLGPQENGYYNLLKRNAPDNVSIVLSPLRRVKETLGRAKVYLHCMENEHFGITIVEAMAAGCVPVVHNSGGPREIVTEDVGYRWENVPEAAYQVSRVMTSDQLRQKLSRASSKRALQFSNEEFESSLIRVLNAYRP